MNRFARPLAIALVATLPAAPALAHSLHVLATRPAVEPKSKTTVFLAWGHLLPVDELVDAADLDTYRVHAPSGATRDLPREGRSFQAHELTPEEPGLHQVSAARKATIFTSYKAADGQHAFLRKPKNEVTIPEGATGVMASRSRMFAKAVILAGGAAASPMNPLGHPLEIIVEDPPGAGGYSSSKPLKVRVLFRGKPLADAKIGAASTRLNPDGGSSETTQTDAEGRATLELTEPGTWVLDVMHKVAATGDDARLFDADSYLATLSVPVAE